MPRNYAEDFARSWVPPIIEAAIDLHRAMQQYKYNEDAHIEDTLEAISKLQMRRMCLVLNEFVMAFNISVGVEPDDVTDDAGDDGQDDGQPTGTADATLSAQGCTEIASESPSTGMMIEDDPASLVGLS